MPHRDNRESHLLQVLRHLHGTPAVESDLADVVLRAQVLDELLDESVMNDISFRRIDVPLSLPDVVEHVVTLYTDWQCLFRQPEVRQDLVLAGLRIIRWEDQHERRDIRSTRQVQPAVTNPATEVIRIDRKSTGIPLVHRHPADGLLHPLVKPELPECILLRGILLGGFTRLLHLVDGDRDPKRRIRFLPYLRVRPVLGFRCSVDHRVEGLVCLPAFDDIQCLLVYLIADGVLVISCCCDQEIQWLGTGITGALCHDIKHLPVRDMQLVIHDTGNVEAVFAVCLCRQDLIDTVRRLEDHLLLGSEDLGPLGKCRCHPHHIHGDLKDNAGLLTVRSAGVNFRSLFPVTAAEIQCHRCCQFTLTLLLRNLHIGCVKLPVAIRFDHSEDVPDDLLLPVDKVKGLSGPASLGMAETLDKGDSIIGSVLVVMRVRCHESGRCIFF